MGRLAFISNEEGWLLESSSNLGDVREMPLSGVFSKVSNAVSMRPSWVSFREGMFRDAIFYPSQLLSDGEI